MNTENLDTTTIEQKNPKMFSQDEVEQLIRDRTEKERVNSRLKNEENEKLKRQLEDYEAKLQKGTASADEMQQLDTAKQAAAQGQQQGYTAEQVQSFVSMAMEQKQLETKLQDAYEKDPEFKKLVEENKKTGALSGDEVLATAYLPNSVAVVKHIMKDPKSLAVYKTAQMRSPTEVMMVLNNFSDRLSDKQEVAHASTYEPAAPLSDASDESQAFDLKNYINSKY